MGNTRALLAPLFVAALHGCVETVPATQVIVEITSDLVLGEELSEVRVFVGSEDGESTAEEQPFELSPGASGAQTLPLLFAVVPGPEGGSFRITVEGYGPNAKGAHEKTVEQRAKVRFTPRKATRMTLSLNRICKDVLCDESLETVCYVSKDGATEAGECGPLGPATAGTVVNPQTLDASVSPLTQDAGKDGGLDAQAERETGPDEAGQPEEAGDDDRSSSAASNHGAPVPGSGSGTAGPHGAPEAGPDPGAEAGSDAGAEAGPDTVASDSGIPDEAGFDRDGCIIWVEGQSTLALPSSAIQRGSEKSFASWPLGPVSDAFHYVCQVDVLGARLPGKLVSGYGCYTVHGSEQVSRDQFRVPTLAPASQCRVRWVESGSTLPANAVIAGERQGMPLVPCEAPVSAGAFPLDAGDTYAAHMNDTHLGYTAASDYGCNYEYVKGVYRADAGFSVLVWDP